MIICLCVSPILIDKKQHKSFQAQNLHYSHQVADWTRGCHVAETKSLGGEKKKNIFGVKIPTQNKRWNETTFKD